MPDLQAHRSPLRRAWPFVWPGRRDAAVIIGLLVCQAAVSAFLPPLLSRGAERELPPRDIGLLLLAVAVVGVVTWWLNGLRIRLARRMVAAGVRAMRTAAVRSVLAMETARFDRVGAPAVLSRIASDTETFSAVSASAVEVANQALFIAMLLPVLVLVDWRLTLVTAGLAVAILAVTRVVRRLSRVAAVAGSQATADLNAELHEAVHGVRVWRDFGHEEAVARRVRETSEYYRSAMLRRDLTLGLSAPLLLLLVGVANAAVVFVGGLGATAGLLSLPSWYLFALVIDRFWQPFASLSSLGTQVQAGLAALERLLDLIDRPDLSDLTTFVAGRAQAAPAGVCPPAGARPTGGDGGRLRGELVLDRVSMWYSDQVQALNGLSLHVSAGESVGLVGLSGAGKSTVLKVLSRLYPYQTGQVRVDGWLLEELPLAELRRRVVMVPQEPFLCRGSVADNIRLGHEGLSDRDLASLTAEAGCAEWLDLLPAGIDTDVGERGHLLSAGQRQVIALLRAFARRPAVLLLDEPTAVLDPLSEQQICRLLATLLPGRTALVVAHRLTTVSQLDRLAVVRAGAIVEQGTHAQLLAVNGHYARFNDDFFGSAAEPEPAGKGER